MKTCKLILPQLKSLRYGDATFNYFTLGAQPLVQPWGSYTNLWDLKVTSSPKTTGIDKIISSPVAKVTAGWPLPMMNHSAAFKVVFSSQTFARMSAPPLPSHTYTHTRIYFNAQCILTHAHKVRARTHARIVSQYIFIVH